MPWQRGCRQEKCAMASSLSERFWKQVNKNGPIVRAALGRCWLWTGRTREGRYGAVSFGGDQERAHRVSFFLAHARWPNPNCLHRCDVTLCVRPSHLFEGTQLDNVKDCWRKGRGNNLPGRIAAARKSKSKRFCPQGHEYTSENTYTRNGSRSCITCMRQRTREWRIRNGQQSRIPNR
jgi:hypothetical protein